MFFILFFYNIKEMKVCQLFLKNTLLEVAQRIREMREIDGVSPEQMAQKTGVTLNEYLDYESGKRDFPFSFYT